MAEVENAVKLTDEVRQKLEQAFALDCTVEEACFYAEISKQTYYNWVESFPELKERFDNLRQTPVLKARQTVVKSLDDPNHAFRYLERKRKDEFSPRTEQVNINDQDVNEALDSIQDLIKQGQSNEQGSPQNNAEPIQGGAKTTYNTSEI